MRSKWRLASAPYKDANLFGEAFDPILIENKDKKKTMPYMYRGVDHRYSYYPFSLIITDNCIYRQNLGPISRSFRDHLIRDMSSSYLPIVTEGNVKLLSSGPFVGQAVTAFVEANDYRTTSLISDRLQFAGQWEGTTTNVWVLQTVGLTVEFLSNLPNRFIHCPVPVNIKKRNLMEAKIRHLLEINTIKPVPEDQEG